MTESSPYRPLDRRPLAARNWRVSHVMTAALVRLGVSPNAISIVGMLCAVAAALPRRDEIFPDWVRWWWLIGAALILKRGLANMLDGMVAVASGKASPVGELYNEMPDRVSDAAMLVGLGYAAGGDPVLGFCAALAAVFTAYVRAMAKVAGAPQDYCGPMAKIQRMVVVIVVALYGGLAPADWQWQWGPARAGLWVVLAGCIITSLRRIGRAARHLRKAPPCIPTPATGSSTSATPSTIPSPSA